MLFAGGQMADFDQRQLLTNALPLLAVVLMASGILVKTLPFALTVIWIRRRSSVFRTGTLY